MIDRSPIQEVPPPITIPDDSYRLQTSSLAGPQDYQLHDGALLQLDLGTELTLIAEPANPYDKYPARVPARKQPPRLPPPGQVTTSSPAASNKARPSLPKSPGSTAKKIPPSPSTSASKKSPHKSDGSRQLRFWPPTKLPKTKYSPFKNRCSTFSALPPFPPISLKISSLKNTQEPWFLYLYQSSIDLKILIAGLLHFKSSRRKLH